MSMKKLKKTLWTNKWWILLHLISFFVVKVFIQFTIQVLKHGSNVITFKFTVLFYLGITILFCYAVYFSKIKRYKGIVVGTLSLMLMMLIAETVLRFGAKTKQTYLEEKGGNVYQSPYRQRAYIKEKNQPSDDEIVWGYEANSSRMESCSEFSFQHTYNDEGIRDESISVEKNENEIRLLCLGDSFTEGVGASQDSTWPQLLELKYDQKYGSNKYTCINAGVAGSDPIDEYYMLEKMLKYQPDLVLLCINSSEPKDIVTRGGFERYRNGKLNQKYGPFWEPLFALSYIFRHVMMDVFHYTFELKTPRQMESEFMNAYQILENAIFEIEKVAQQNKADFVLIYTPSEYEMRTKDILMDSFMEHLAKTSNLEIIYTISCLDQFMFENGNYIDKYYWKADRHFNSEGYNILADCIFTTLEHNKE